METPSFYTNKIFQISSSFLLPDTLTKGQVIMYRLRGGEGGRGEGFNHSWEPKNLDH